MGQQETAHTADDRKLRRRKILLSLGAVAAVGALVGGGTYATFNAQTANPGNVWANGTLILSNKVARPPPASPRGPARTPTRT